MKLRILLLRVRNSVPVHALGGPLLNAQLYFVTKKLDLDL